jgi:hypothetical protein
MLRLSMYSTKGPSGQRRKSLRRHPAAVATSREGHRPLIRLVRLLYAGHVPVARGRFAYEHLRPAISYSRVRTGQTLRQCRAVAIFGLVVDLRARSDWSALLTVSTFATPGYTHRLSLTATSLRRATLASGLSRDLGGVLLANRTIVIAHVRARSLR